MHKLHVSLLLASLALLAACQGIVRGAIKGGINDGLAVAGPPGSDFQKLADDLYTYRWLGYRTAFVTTPDGVILFDPLNARASTEIKAHLAELAPRNPHVKIIIYSHNHADHESGAAVFAGDAPRIIATANAAADIAAHPSPEVAPPTETFSEPEKTLTFGGVTLNLIHLPNGHTNDMLAIHIPHRRAVFAVDGPHVKMIPPIGAPYTSFHGALDQIDRIQRIDYDTIIPGHGGWGTKQDVVAYRQMLVDIRDALLRQAAARGLKDFHDGRFFQPDVLGDVIFAAIDELTPKYGAWRGWKEFQVADFDWVMTQGIYMNE